jgi:geranylgeranyl pyrophosphate synthase
LLALVASELEAVKHYIISIAPPSALTLAQSTQFARQVSGKLIRPGLTLLGAKALGLPTNEALIQTASVSELIHVATLLHDDVLDAAETRRGQPTVSALYGNKIAILSGDWMLAQASRTLAEVGNVPLIALFSHVLADLCDGEVEQLRSAYDLQATTWDTYTHKTYGKTASLFAAAAQAPALLGRLPLDEVSAWRQFGYQVGMAFQWMDDLLDYTGDAEKLGKPVLDDLKNGLPNAPILLALAEDSPLSEAAQTELAGRVTQVFEWAKQPGPLPDEQAQALEALCLTIRDTLAEQGILQAVQAKAQGAIEQAVAALPPRVVATEAGQALCQLAHFVVLRNV